MITLFTAVLLSFDPATNSCKVVEAPPPVVTPAPSATLPPQSATPAPIPASCKDGYLNKPVGQGFGLADVVIKDGEVKEYCAQVTTSERPLVFQLYDISDRDCARASMKIARVDGAYSAGDDTPLSGITLNVPYKWFVFTYPERVAPGIFKVTVKGSDSQCNHYRITWGAK